MFFKTDGEDLAIAKTQAEVFEKSCALGLDSGIFVREYMNSHSAWLMDLPYHKIRWNGGNHLLAQFLSEKQVPQGSVWNQDVMFWIGYTYRMWHSLTKQLSGNIYALANEKVMLANYPKMHMDNIQSAVAHLLARQGVGQENHPWGAFPKPN